MVNPKLFSISAAVLTAYVHLLSDNPFGLKVGGIKGKAMNHIASMGLVYITYIYH